MYKLNVKKKYNSEGRFRHYINIELAMVLILTNIIFLVLYRDYIFEDAAYVFGSIGFDTISQYVPYYIFEGEQFRTGNLLNYSFQMGLGGFPFTQIVSLLNPFDVVILFCNSSNIYVGILVSLYLKIMFISVVSFFYFRIVFHNKYVQIGCSLIWTFCSYIVLWGQHYSFATNIAYFSIFMLLLQLYLKDDKFVNKWIPIIVFFFSLQSYYILYMTGIFAVIYVIGYRAINEKKWKYCFRKVMGLASMAVLGILMAAISIFVSVGSLLTSSRSDAASFQIFQEIFNFRSFTYLFTVIARLLSNDTIGIENYAGWGNYYEAPMLFTSGLFIFSLIYTFFGNGKWKRALLYFFGIFAIFSVFISRVMTGFMGEYLRWTFVICFCMVLSIGYMLENRFAEVQNDKKKNILVSVFGGILYIVLYTFLFICSGDTAQLNKTAIVFSIIFAVIYAGYLLFVNRAKSRLYGEILLGVIVLEMIICNNASVNNRDIITKQGVQVYAQDGAVELIHHMKEQDSGLYRTKKLYGIVQLNDALAQGFYGLSNYYSVQPFSVNQFMEENQIPPLLYITCIDIPEERYIIRTLLGEKYLIALRGQDVDEINYELVYEGQDTLLYKNKNVLPFGYLYYNSIAKSQFSALAEEDKDFVLTDNFYFTDETDEVLGMFDSKEDDMGNHLDQLGNHVLNEVQFTDNTLSGSVVNNPQEAMLCVPVFYEYLWKAYIDGSEQQVYNINGGLLGIPVPAGNHEIQVVYSNYFLKWGGLVSILSWALYFAVCIIDKRQAKQ